MAAYIAADAFNEGTASFLYYMSAMGLSLGPNAHLYAQKDDAQRVTISHNGAQESTREERMIRRQHQIELLEAAKKPCFSSERKMKFNKREKDKFLSKQRTEFSEILLF